MSRKAIRAIAAHLFIFAVNAVGSVAQPQIVAGEIVAGEIVAGELDKPAVKPVSFKLANPNKPLILLAAKVNGSGPYQFVLDTGAGLTMISPDLAKKLHIKSEEAQKALGAGGIIEVHFGTAESLAIGETRSERLKVGIMDLTGISKAIGTEIDGIVGYNFLSRFRVTIDYPKHTVSFE